MGKRSRRRVRESVRESQEREGEEMMPMRPSLVFCLLLHGFWRNHQGDCIELRRGNGNCNFHPLISICKIFIVTLLLVPLYLLFFLPFIFSIDGDSIPVCFLPPSPSR